MRKLENERERNVGRKKTGKYSGGYKSRKVRANKENKEKKESLKVRQNLGRKHRSKQNTQKIMSK